MNDSNLQDGRWCNECHFYEKDIDRLTQELQQEREKTERLTAFVKETLCANPDCCGRPVPFGTLFCCSQCMEKDKLLGGNGSGLDARIPEPEEE